MWSYQVKLYEERELAVIDVMSVSSGEEGGVTVNTIPSLTNHTQSVILAQVLQADNPVLDDRVTATISGPWRGYQSPAPGQRPRQPQRDGGRRSLLRLHPGVRQVHRLPQCEGQRGEPGRDQRQHSERGWVGGREVLWEQCVEGERRRTEDHIGGCVK